MNNLPIYLILKKIKSLNLFKKATLLVFSLFITNCIHVKTLEDGHVMVPLDSKFYKNKSHFNIDLLQNIDTSCIYKEIKVNEKSTIRNKTGIYKFYGNGYFNLFYSTINDTTIHEKLDPNYNGWRGICYLKDNEILGDMFIRLETDSNNYGKFTTIFKVNGDTILADVEGYYKRKYLKQKINGLDLHRPNW